MPIYEYACTACGRRTEAKQSFTDPPLEECPHCGGKLRKHYSPVGIVFKGSGFYSTDGKKSSSKTSESSGDKGDKSDDKSSGTKPSTKAGAKTDPGAAKSEASSPAKSATAKSDGS